MSGVPEDEPQRLARNINDLLQELRVALAGVQILFGFLLSIVFTDTPLRRQYLAAVLGASHRRRAHKPCIPLLPDAARPDLTYPGVPGLRSGYARSNRPEPQEDADEGSDLARQA